jgi:protein SCO1/2
VAPAQWSRRAAMQAAGCAIVTAACARWGVARATESPDAHAHHRHVVPELRRSLADYTVPRVRLVRDDGRAIQLDQELDDGRPIVLSFIYTSCTSVCPVTSHTLSELQQRLGSERDGVHFVSISIDPEYDTPQRLREYGRKFNAGPNWQHYTGTLSASVAAQRAFGVYRGDKMNHVPATLLRAKPGDRWVRIDGFATADQLLSELRGICTTSK